MAKGGWDQLLDWSIETDRRLWSHPYAAKRDGWRSSAFGYCPRRLVMERSGIPITDEPDAKTRRTFAWGDNVHWFVKNLYVKAGLMIEDEVPMEWGSLTGHLDCLVGTLAEFDYQPRPVEAEPVEKLERWSPEWQEYLTAYRADLAGQKWFGDLAQPTGLEIKSVHSYGMRKLHSEGPYRHHWGQLASYALMERETHVLPVKPDRWRLQYVGKDSVGTLTYELPGGMIDRAEQKLIMLDEHWKAGTLPPCTCSQTGQIRFCAYKTDGGGCCGLTADELLGRALQGSLDMTGEDVEAMISRGEYGA